MSIEYVCRLCGEEYDCRWACCPCCGKTPKALCRPFRHVGQCIQCEAGVTLDSPKETAGDSDELELFVIAPT